ncbi:MAG: NUDIX domain-containing protein, partial [Bacteroidetes bacterium]|nr:NUDIX domain-containing protein [Bacteroidota bacterium]
MIIQFNPPLASITVDCVLFGFIEGELNVLLIKRGSEPELGKWALPGGFMEKDEDVDLAAARVLELLTGVKDVFMQQFHVFGKPNRHPLARVVTVGYYALIDANHQKLKPSWHASETAWVNISKMPKLAFDHMEIFESALKTLQKELNISPIVFELLPTKFTLRELQNLFEIILGKTLDRRNFRRRLKIMDILVELDEVRPGAHVGATLFKFDKKKYKALEAEGFD